MASLHVRATEAHGRHRVYTGRWLQLERISLRPGDDVSISAPANDEGVVLLLSGDVVWNGGRAARSSVFDERAHAAYLPAGTTLDAHANSVTDLLLGMSRFGDVEPRGEVVLVDPSRVTVRQRGRDTWEREVHDVAVDQVPARHLLVGETFNVAGGWSSFPPHKHDGTDGEPELEEVYSFRFDPPEGFGFQAVEQAGDPQAFLIRDGDTVGIPGGYHPVCAAPGYRLYYAWFLSGPVRQLEMVEDARYSWLHEHD
ncbi:MAG: 5-deoxy-glucuronate isomerase [Actinobacteria bacterium]|nr:MAG: 5-deoxy-glucuronate isomerase [Actinomycetota bacterium]